MRPNLSTAEWRGSMHCPGCGTQALDKQKYCRSCGMDLEMISHAISGHLSSADSGQISPESDRSAARRIFKMLLWGMGAVLVGMALIAASKEIQYVGAVGLLLTLLGAF